jgi:hypothetical protein
MNAPIFQIDGNRCTDFAALISEFNRVFGEAWGKDWQGNLDAFNDMLDWPNNAMLDWPNDRAPYVLSFFNSEAARRHLGHLAMADWLRNKLSQCEPGFGETWREELKSAENGQGRTLFDWLVEIIRDHPQIDLRLE